MRARRAVMRVTRHCDCREAAVRRGRFATAEARVGTGFLSRSSNLGFQVAAPAFMRGGALQRSEEAPHYQCALARQFPPARLALGWFRFCCLSQTTPHQNPTLNPTHAIDSPPSRCPTLSPSPPRRTKDLSVSSSQRLRQSPPKLNPTSIDITYSTINRTGSQQSRR